MESGTWHCELRLRNDPQHRDLPCMIRFLGQADLDALHALHRHVVERLPHPAIFRADGRGFMVRHIAERGRTLGAYHDSELVGYAVLSFPRHDSDNLGLDLGFRGNRLLRTANYDGSAVHPRYRGNRLHRRMNALRAEYAIAAGYNQLFGTVSPLNSYSLRNHLTAGFFIKHFLIKYGGVERFLIHRDGCRAVLDPGLKSGIGGERVALEDIRYQKELLANGYWGYDLVIAGERLLVDYAPSESLSALL